MRGAIFPSPVVPIVRTEDGNKFIPMKPAYRMPVLLCALKGKPQSFASAEIKNNDLLIQLMRGMART